MFSLHTELCKEVLFPIVWLWIWVMYFIHIFGSCKEFVTRYRHSLFSVPVPFRIKLAEIAHFETQKKWTEKYSKQSEKSWSP
jgi:hypothetical protein